jgi:uncharacterized damage-inducible protein DinB
MATKAVQQETISARLIAQWEQVGGKLAALVEELPANKFEYTPVEGARTVGDVLRHVAFWNHVVADRARGKKADEAANELAKAKFSTKTEVLAALKRSAEDATKALNENSSGLTPEQCEMLVSFIEHNCAHYGQLVVYARLNGIVPPASRG